MVVWRNGRFESKRVIIADIQLLHSDAADYIGVRRDCVQRHVSHRCFGIRLLCFVCIVDRKGAEAVRFVQHKRIVAQLFKHVLKNGRKLGRN